MAGEKKNIASVVEDAIIAPLKEIGLGIWDVEYVKEGSEWYLRITIDSEKGVDIDDCEKAYRLIDPIITEMDPIENSYHLEVSSPGIERDLRTKAHYEASVGEVARFKFFTQIDGQKEVIGLLKSIDAEGNVVIETEKGEMTVDFKKISKANLYFNFDEADE